MKTVKLIMIMSSLVIGLLISQPSMAATKAVIVHLSGAVKVNGTPAVLDQVLITGDRIQTGPDGICEVTIGTNSVMRCSINTDLTLKFDEPVKRLTLSSGAIGKFVRETGLFKKMMRFLSSRKRFEIETPTSVIGVRGTTFYVRVEDRHNSYICCCNGEISTMDIDQQNRQKIRAAHHKAVRITKGEEGFAVREAEMLYHTDEEMESLAGTISESIDWSKPSR